LVIEYIVIGFLSALGWWGANYFVIAPHLPEPTKIEKKVESNEQKNEQTNK
jgi:hypothetical protein